MKLIKKLGTLVILGMSLMPLPANAHVVGIGWEALNNGDVTFYANQYHGNVVSAPGSLSVNGSLYGWQSYIWDTNVSDLGLDGYAATSYGNPSNVEDWLTVTISGLSDGAYSLLTIGGSAVDAWWDGRTPVTARIDVVDNQVPEPSSLALLGLGLAGLGFARRRKGM